VPADSQLTRSWEIDLSPPDEFRPEQVSPLRTTTDGAVYYAAGTRRDDSERTIALTRIVDGSIDDRISVDSFASGANLSIIDLAMVDETAMCSFRTNSLPTDGSLSGELVTFDLSTGETQYVEDRPGGGPITVSGETIYVGTVFEQGGFSTEDGTAGVAAIDPRNGTVRWERELAAFSFAGETYPPSSMRPAVYGGSVYVSSPDGIHRLDPATGTSTVITERDGPCLIDGNLGLLYVVGENEITALDLTLGSASVAGAVTVEGTPRGAAVSDGALVVTTDGSITALDVTANRTLWRHTEEAITSLPSIAGDTVYYLGIDGLRCRSLSSGEGIRSSPVTLRDDADQLPESVSREPIVADGSVFVRSRNAVLAIEATDSS
jgi:outer membrane protein assembly factor BamB